MMRIPREIYKDGELVETTFHEIADEQAAAMVKAEAGRRIEARYPLFKQVNLQAAGGAPFQRMRAWVDAMRAKCTELEQSQPGDFMSDHHWPEA